MNSYWILIGYSGLCFMIATLLVVITKILTPKKLDAEKLSAYECGFETFAHSRIQLNIQFYVFAVLFLLFDLEIIILVPWVLHLHQIGEQGFAVGFIFYLILIVGFIIEWLNGAFTWKRG